MCVCLFVSECAGVSVCAPGEGRDVKEMTCPAQGASSWDQHAAVLTLLQISLLFLPLLWFLPLLSCFLYPTLSLSPHPPSSLSVFLSLSPTLLSHSYLLSPPPLFFSSLSPVRCLC